MLIPNNEKNWYSVVTSECLGYPIPAETIKNCLDVGCNVGGFVNAWKSRIQKFYCIDASEYNIEQAVNNHKDMVDVDERIFFIHSAVHSKSGETLFLRPYQYGENCSNSGSFGTTNFVYKSNGHGWVDGDLKEEVSTISLEDVLEDALLFFGEEEIDLMKIDIEGAEYDFLFNKDLSKIKWISGEIHNFLSKMPSDENGIDRNTALHNHILKTHTLEYSGGDGVDTHFVRLYKRINNGNNNSSS